MNPRGWYTVEHPFSRPVVHGPFPSKSFAIEKADKIHGTSLRRVGLSDGAEVWIGGVIVCSKRKANHYKFKIKNWKGEYANAQ